MFSPVASRPTTPVSVNPTPSTPATHRAGSALALDRLPVDVLKEVVAALPNDRRELRNASLVSRGMHAVVRKYSAHKLKMLDLAGAARRALSLPPLGQVRAFQHVVSTADEHPFPLRGGERDALVADLVVLLERMHGLTRASNDESTERPAMLKSLANLILASGATEDKLTRLHRLIRQVVLMPSPQLKDLLDHVGSTLKARVHGDAAEALAGFIARLGAAAALQETSQAGRSFEARHLLGTASAGHEEQLPDAADRRLLMKYVLHHSVPHAGDEGVLTFRSAVDLALAEPCEDDRMKCLHAIMGELPLLEDNRRRRLIEHAFDRVWHADMSEGTTADASRLLLDNYGAAQGNMAANFADQVVASMCTFVDPQRRFDGIIRALRKVGPGLSPASRDAALSQALQVAITEYQSDASFDKFDKVVGVIGELPEDARGSALRQVLGEAWGANLDDEKKLMCMNRLMRFLHSYLGDDAPAIAELALDKTKELRQEKDRLAGLVYVLGHCGHHVPGQRLAAAMGEALGLLRDESLYETGRATALNHVLSSSTEVDPASASTLFEQAIQIVSGFKEEVSRASCVRRLTQTAARAEDTGKALSRIMDAIGKLTDPHHIMHALCGACVDAPALDEAERERLRRFVLEMATPRLTRAPFGAVQVLASAASLGPSDQAKDLLAQAIATLHYIPTRDGYAEARRLIVGTGVFRAILNTDAALRESLPAPARRRW